MRSSVLAQALSMAAIGSAMMSDGFIPQMPTERVGNGYKHPKTVLNKRQQKARKKAKSARKSRQRNRS